MSTVYICSPDDQPTRTPANFDEFVPAINDEIRRTFRGENITVKFTWTNPAKVMTHDQFYALRNAFYKRGWDVTIGNIDSNPLVTKMTLVLFEIDK